MLSAEISLSKGINICYQKLCIMNNKLPKANTKQLGDLGLIFC